MITSSSSNNAMVGAGIDPGTVTVTLQLDTPASRAWQLLTEPTMVARWFGTLTGTLAPGQPARLDFGDGDFFDLETLRLDPPFLLEYTWRFLGIGPLDTITWHIAPQEQGCLVTVIDSEPGRSHQSARELKEGWLDFTQRLEQFLVAGYPSRYDWRRQFDGSIEIGGNLESVWDSLFAPHRQPQWLPLLEGVLEEGGQFVAVDPGEAFQISDVYWYPPHSMRFHLKHSGWLCPTYADLKLSSHAQGTLLSVSHTGWERISPNENYQLAQRKRFSTLWIMALQRACEIRRSHAALP
jgi:uncharacterized protein YndB with AHSA1/START domain